MLNTTKFLVIDTETTGLNPQTDRVVEVATVLIVGGRIVSAFTSYVNPQRDISSGSSAIHGLVTADVSDSQTLEELLPRLNALVSEADVIVAHNAPFDKSMLPGLIARPWLDTLPLARKLFPDAENHRNGTLRYVLNLHCPEANGMPSHRALSDAYVTARLLLRLLQDLPPETLALDLIKELSRPQPHTGVLRFGKHKGMMWSEVPKAYLTWLDKSSSCDEDVKFSARYWLAQPVTQ